MARLRVLTALLVLISLTTCSVQPLWAGVPTEYQPKYDEGFALGYPRGYTSGLADGKGRGWLEGKEKGNTEGYDAGWSAAYSPAFDLAYDTQYPVGHLAGWEAGLVTGFEEGFNYAPTIIAASGITGWADLGNYGSGIVMVSNGHGGFFGPSDSMSGTLTVDLIDFTYDWAKHYFDDGFATGRDRGFSVGSDEGYKVNYPIGYATGYNIGHRNGIDEGTTEGIRAGGEQGFDDGWGEAYDGGFDEGFYAGIDYHLYGGFLEPQYDFQYTPRSNAATLSAFRALHAPEPACLLLVGLAAAAGILRRPKRLARS